MPKIVFDTDMGSDDVTALLMLAGDPKVEIVAITTVFGNVSLLQATRNAEYCCEMLNRRHIPIYAGAHRPIVREPTMTTWTGHGPKGLGDIDPDNPSVPLPFLATSTYQHCDPDQRRPRGDHAALALINLANKYPGEIDLLMVGPLTNLALAMRMDSGLPKKYKSLWIMGGTVWARGNKNMTAEFNFEGDPEAAHVVISGWFEASGNKANIIPWETTVDCGLSWKAYDDLIASSSPLMKFYERVTAHTVQLVRYGNRPPRLRPSRPNPPVLTHHVRPTAAPLIAHPESDGSKTSSGGGKNEKTAKNGGGDDPNSKRQKVGGVRRDDGDGGVVADGEEEEKKRNEIEEREEEGRVALQEPDADIPEHRFIMCDAYAVAAMLHEDCILEYQDVYCEIELHGTLTRGMSAIDWNGRHEANTRMISKLDVTLFGRVLHTNFLNLH